MKTITLVKIKLIPRHFWQTEIMYDLIYHLQSTKFTYTNLNTCVVLWPDFISCESSYKLITST